MRPKFLYRYLIMDIRFKQRSPYVGKNGYVWESNPCLHQPETYAGSRCAAMHFKYNKTLFLFAVLYYCTI